jgi:hypothetical protein
MGCQREEPNTQAIADGQSPQEGMTWSNPDSTFRVLLKGDSITFLDVAGDEWLPLEGRRLEVDESGWCQFEEGAIAVGSIDDAPNELTLLIENVDSADLDSITLKPKGNGKGAKGKGASQN